MIYVHGRGKVARKDFDVLAIGNAVVDVLVSVDDDFLLQNQLIKGGMTLVKQPIAEDLMSSLQVQECVCGGSAANTSVGVASLGGSAAFIGRVKKDYWGDEFVSSIRDMGVRYETPQAQEGAATAHCLIAVTPDAERTMQTFLGASTELEPSDINDQWLDDTAIVFLEGYLWSCPHGQEVLTKAAQRVKAAGGRVAFSLSDGSLVMEHRHALIPFMKTHVDIVFANGWEAETLCDSKEQATQEQFLLSLCETVIATRSEQGSVILQGKERHEVAAYARGGVVDMTGAGDLYAAGFLWGLAHDKTLAECGHVGAWAAEEVISHIGGRPAQSLQKLIVQGHH